MKGDSRYAFLPGWQTGCMLICAVVFAFLFNNVLDRRRRNPRNLPNPPGPPRVPFFGNTFDLGRPGLAWETYAEWAQVHGDIIFLKAPGSSILILSSIPVITDLVERRSSKYSDKVQLPGLEIAKAGWAMGFQPYGPWWRMHRRSFHQLINQNAVSKYRPIIQLHTRKFLRRLIKNPKDFLDHAQVLFGEIILHMAYGTKDEGYIKHLTMIAEEQVQGVTSVLVPGRFLVNNFPILRFVPEWCPGAGWKKDLKHLAFLTEEMTFKTFEDAKQRIKDGTLDELPSLVAQLLERLPVSDGPDAQTQELVSRNVAAVAYIAGADTTVASAWSFILALAMYPEIQRKAQKEIDTAIGPGRLPEFDDLSRLPYLRALLKEVVRFWPVAPLSLPHATSEDDVYNDYFVPRGTIVITNTWSIFRDPQHYPDPLEFRPERFLKDGQINPEVLDPESCVFGYGRRICPGRYLSQESLGLMATSLLALFNVTPSKDGSGNPVPLIYTPNGDIIVKPERFECCITPRSPMHAALVADDVALAQP